MRFCLYEVLHLVKLSPATVETLKIEHEAQPRPAQALYSLAWDVSMPLTTACNADVRTVVPFFPRLPSQPFDHRLYYGQCSYYRRGVLRKYSVHRRVDTRSHCMVPLCRRSDHRPTEHGRLPGWKTKPLPEHRLLGHDSQESRADRVGIPEVVRPWLLYRRMGPPLLSLQAIYNAHIPEGATMQTIPRHFLNGLFYVDFMRHVRQ
jgi:hypothetical protein